MIDGIMSGGLLVGGFLIYGTAVANVPAPATRCTPYVPRKRG